MSEMCHCGKPLHYNSPDVQAAVQKLVDEKGEFVKITVSGRSFMVQRHYIALHGIKGSEIEELGFEEVPT